MNTTTNRLLAAVLVLQVITLAGQWSGHAGSNEARADLPPDPAAQRIAQTQAMNDISRKLDRLVTILESGRLEVKVSNIGDANKGGNAGNNAGNAGTTAKPANTGSGEATIRSTGSRR